MEQEERQRQIDNLGEKWRCDETCEDLLAPVCGQAEVIYPKEQEARAC